MVNVILTNNQRINLGYTLRVNCMLISFIRVVLHLPMPSCKAGCKAYTTHIYLCRLATDALPNL